MELNPIPTHPLDLPQTPMFAKLLKIAPFRDIASTAVEHLKDPTEIQAFYREYIAWLGTPPGAVSDPEASANTNIGFWIGAFNRKIADVWLDTLPDISHPEYDRDLIFSKPEPLPPTFDDNDEDYE
jgi:hypothetical protein